MIRPIDRPNRASYARPALPNTGRNEPRSRADDRLRGPRFEDFEARWWNNVEDVHFDSFHARWWPGEVDGL